MCPASAALTDLNDRQREAVDTTEGPLLIMAGPGSGKTRVITHRIARLIEIGVPSANILAVTFTNKAAREMQARVGRMIGRSGATICTFHAFGMQLLRSQGTRLGLGANITIFDRADTENALKICLGEAMSDADGNSASAIADRISGWKSELVSPERAIEVADTGEEDRAAAIYGAYQKLLERSSAVDFDDLLYRTVELLENHADLRAAINELYRYVLIDEYQDVNKSQHRLTRLLGDVHRNVCATGDPDQCIYSWRGASIDYILGFTDDYPGAKVVKLEQNYRSVNVVLEAASHLIRFNTRSGGMRLWSQKPAGDRIAIRRVGDEVEEGLAVQRRVRDLIDRGTRPSDIAIFYRLNSLSFPIESALMSRGIPYQVVQGLEFFKRKEVKDLLAWLRFLANRDDEVSLRRIINLPARGIGSKTVESLAAAAHSAERSLGAFLQDARPSWADGLTKRAVNAVQEFVTMAAELATFGTHSPSRLIQSIVEKTGYGSHLEKQAPYGSDPYGNVQQLAAHASRFEQRRPDAGLQPFLDEVALISDVDAHDADVEKVSLMTVHASKGLEFRHVIVAGMDDKIFPHVRQRGGTTDIEEERRLFYVAVTRAMESLELVTVDVRHRFGQRDNMQPSPFLSEIPEEVTDVRDDVATRMGSSLNSAVVYDHDDSGDFFDDADFRIANGARVSHGEFGTGTVIKIRGRGPDARVKVVFESGDVRELVLRYAKLQSLEEY